MGPAFFTYRFLCVGLLILRLLRLGIREMRYKVLRSAHDHEVTYISFNIDILFRLLIPSISLYLCRVKIYPHIRDVSLLFKK
jgi:hypothetical protein